MLETLIRKSPSEVEAEYCPGFWVTVRHMPRNEWLRAERSRVVYRGGRLEDSGLMEALQQAVIRAVVNWRGLTPKILLEHFNLDLDWEQAEALGDTEIPCTEENKRVLLLNDLDFQNWVWDICSDIRRLRQLKLEAAAKNSPTTQGGA